jgi:Transposase domain (DUF772)
MGRPSVDPELMIRMLIVGYCFGIRSKRLHNRRSRQPPRRLAEAHSENGKQVLNAARHACRKSV